MKENLQIQIKTLVGDVNQNHPYRYLGFAAGLVNNLDQHRNFFNEFIISLARTSDKDLIDLVKENPEAFPYLLLLRECGKENHSTLSNLMQTYVEELKIYVNNLENYIQDTETLDGEWKNYFDNSYFREWTAGSDLENCKQWIEYFEETTIAHFIYNKFIALETVLELEEGLAETDENLLDSLHKKTLETEAALMQNFNEIAATQLPSLGLDAGGLESTLTVLKAVNLICVKYYINRTYSNELVSAVNIKDGLNGVNSEQINTLIEIKKAEQEQAKIVNVINILNDIKNNLINSPDLKDLITKVNKIFEESIEDENFKTLKNNLNEIIEKKDFGAFEKFLDDAIQFFKSLVGKDRVSATKEVIKKFTDDITKGKITPENIKSLSSEANSSNFLSVG